MKKFLTFLTILITINLYAKICIILPTKNDQALITRSLASIKNHADFICICDQGSTDRTIPIAEEFLKKETIPGKIYYAAENPIIAAQNMLQDLNIPLPEVYLLILQPSMTFSPTTSFNKATLKEDSYLLLEHISHLSFYQYAPHLFRASFSFPPKTTHKLPILIETQVLSAVPQLEKTVENLTKILPKSPEDLFYLAQATKSLKKTKEAIQYYKARLEHPEEKDQVWFSTFMIGECHQALDEWDLALHWYLAAYQLNPSYSEPFQKIANYYRLKGQNELAYFFAKHGEEIPESSDQVLFSANPLCNYQFQEELSIAAFYTAHKNDGYEAAAKLILKKHVPQSIRSQTYRNIVFYTQNLKNAKFTPIHIDLPLVNPTLSKRYNPMNPSIQKIDTGYKLICRAVNYTQTGAKIFQTSDPQNIYRTKNYLITYDTNFQLLSQQEIIENLPRKKHPSPQLEGLEDCRIFSFDHNFWFTCSARDILPSEHPQMALGKLELSENDPVLVTSLIPLLGPDLQRCEKNWLPFIHNQSIHLLYSYDPLLIYKPDLQTGKSEIVFSWQPPLNFSAFRGSAGPIPFDQGYLILVHEIAHQPNRTRIYLHRLLYLDNHFHIQKLTKPFTFLHQGVEFCCSMTLDHSTNNLILPIGIEDREAYLCTIDCETVRDLLEPI